MTTSVLPKASHKRLTVNIFSPALTLSLTSSCSASLCVRICWMWQNNFKSSALMNKNTKTMTKI
jgi:hypothetical protein